MAGEKKAPVVIEISSSSDEEAAAPATSSDGEEEEEKPEKKGKKKVGIWRWRRPRRTYPDVEVMTAEEKLLEDDECCILASNPLEVDIGQKLSLSDSQDDDRDLSVLGERGKVACRDYPHSRHLCVEHPFSKTSHESYCLQCYCYVCDEAAPCKSWKGSAGHCHASDEDKKWKNLRKSVRETRACKVTSS